MHKALPAFLLLSMVLLQTAGASAKLTSHQHENLLEMYKEMNFCKARLKIAADYWIDLSFETLQENDGMTKVTRAMLQAADQLLDTVRKVDDLRVMMSEDLGLSNTEIETLYDKARDHAHAVKPQPVTAQYTSDGMSFCTEISRKSGKALVDILEQE